LLLDEMSATIAEVDANTGFVPNAYLKLAKARRQRTHSRRQTVGASNDLCRLRN
jgi:hypothetical protein